MTGTGEWVRLRRHYAWLPIVTLVTVLATGPAWPSNPDEIDVKPKVNVEDKDDIAKPGSKIWVLDFKFLAPRLITVDIPGRGRKLCWYMRYQVINNTKDPHMFYPKFELVTHDKPGGVY